MYGPTIQSLIDEGVVEFIQPYIDGHFQDVSGGGNHGVPTSTMRMVRGVGAKPADGAGKVVVANSAGLQAVVAGTAICFAARGLGPELDPSNEYFMHKEDQFYWARTATQIRFYDYANLRILSYALEDGQKYTAINFGGDVAPEAFVEGLSVGVLNGASTVTGSTLDLTLLNDPANDNLNATVSFLMLISRKLTATEHMRVYAELCAYRPSTRRYYSARASVQVDPQESGLVGGWDMRQISGIVPDVSGGGNDGVPSGRLMAKQSLLGDALEFDGISSSIDCGDIDLVQPGFTVGAWLKLASGTANDRIIAKGGTNNGNFMISFGTTAKAIRCYMKDDAGHAVDTVGTFNSYTLPLDMWTHLAVVFDLQNSDILLYLDGELKATYNGAGITGNMSSVSTIKLGQATTGQNYDGQMLAPQIYQGCLSAPEILRHYQAGARALQFATGFGSPVSVAAEGGEIGQYLSGTPFQFGDATCRAKVIAENVTWNGSTKLCKAIEWTVPGILYIPTSLFKFANPTEAAFGTWDFYFLKSLDNGTINIGFVHDTPGNEFTAGQDGYTFKFTSAERLQLIESVNGSIVATHFQTAASSHAIQTWYKATITRSTLGEFTAYIDDILLDVSGGSGTNPVTDITKTTAEYISFDFDAGDKLLLSSFDGAWGFRKHLGVVE